MNGLAARRRTTDLPGKASQDLGEPSCSVRLGRLATSVWNLFLAFRCIGEHPGLDLPMRLRTRLVDY